MGGGILICVIFAVPSSRQGLPPMARRPEGSCGLFGVAQAWLCDCRTFLAAGATPMARQPPASCALFGGNPRR